MAGVITRLNIQGTTGSVKTSYTGRAMHNLHKGLDRGVGDNLNISYVVRVRLVSSFRVLMLGYGLYLVYININKMYLHIPK
jgi:hypothetical protein